MLSKSKYCFINFSMALIILFFIINCSSDTASNSGPGTVYAKWYYEHTTYDLIQTPTAQIPHTSREYIEYYLRNDNYFTLVHNKTDDPVTGWSGDYFASGTATYDNTSIHFLVGTSTFQYITGISMGSTASAFVTLSGEHLYLAYNSDVKFVGNGLELTWIP